MRFMNTLVQFDADNGVAVITIQNPPVNALKSTVVDALSAAIARIEGDAQIRAAVIAGAGSNFVAGADINEFVKITSGESSRTSALADLLSRIENCPKPIVAAIHGKALGGGLELAMACHYRVAAREAEVGQPEVKLGLIPGAGGTQRLPRLAGTAKALQMCADGNPISAIDALAVGIVDRLSDGDLMKGAIAFAQEIAGRPPSKTRDREGKLGSDGQNAPLFAAARESARKKYRGVAAPLTAIDAVEAATKLPFEEGCKLEQSLFVKSLFSDESKALVHAFLGQREVAKIPDVPRDTPILAIGSVGIVGAGTMGGGIAMVFANAGIPVILKEADSGALDRGMATIQRNYATSVKRGRFTQQFMDERLNLIKPTLSYRDFSHVDMVVEAAFESMDVKKDVFGELDRACKAEAILASNTSSLDIDAIGSATSRPGMVIGTHFFSPANVMRLLEIVRGRASSKTVIATCMQLAKKLGKVGVLVGNCPGFVGNRMFAPYHREAQFLVEEGSDAVTVDHALYEFGMAMGPLATSDLAGLDIGMKIRNAHKHLEKPGARRPFAEDRLCALGRFGQKTGSGWYKYDENRRGTTDLQVTQLVRAWSGEAKIHQRQISPVDIVDRCIYALINEGARILEEGYALRAADIDIVYLSGYGFPAYRGGPMWYAGTVGLKKVYERICGFQREHGELWEPAPLLQRLAAEGKTFQDFDRERPKN